MIERTQVVAPKRVLPRQIRIGDKTARLTPKETNLFWYLISRQGRVVPHRELLTAVWGTKYIHRLNYLHVFITNLRKKIEPNPAQPQYIETVPWVGYRFSMPEQSTEELLK
jgi:two-component system, OmpR family, KDP operon response regulator KdpE